MDIKVEQVTQPVILGEGPHWDAEQQCLYYVSILEHTIHKFVPSTKKETSTKLSGAVGFIIPLARTTDQFVVGIHRKVLIIKWNGENNSPAEIVSEVAEIDREDDIALQLNDGKADPRGRLFAGTVGIEEPFQSMGKHRVKLYSFNKSGITIKLDNVSLSNGLCWDMSKKMMYYVDSLEYAIKGYDYDLKTGAMCNEQVVFDFKKENLEGFPDGMTIDTDGNIWVACFDGSQVIKVDPIKKVLLQKVAIPVLQVTSVVFGGKDLDELYVTSARMNIDTSQQPPSGATFRVTGLDVKGFPGNSCIL